MPDFVSNVLANAPAVAPGQVLLRLVAALVLGLGVAAIYTRTRPAVDRTGSFPPTLVLLSVLIAMVTQVIGDNVARAFSLVGALSIVRFRTVVRDTQDTAFVIFAVVVGMAVGASDVWVALSGMAIVAVAAFITRPSRSSVNNGSRPFVLQLRVGLGHDLATTIAPTIDKHFKGKRRKKIRLPQDV